MVVAVYQQARVPVAGCLNPQERLLNVRYVSGIAQQHVIEFFRCLEVFGKGFVVTESRVRGARDGDHLRTDFYSDTIGRLECVKQKPGLAPDVEHALARLYDMPKQTLKTLIVILVPANPPAPCLRENRLVLSIAFIL